MAEGATRAESGRDDLYTDERGRLRCRLHGKAAYETEFAAERAAVRMAQKPTADPGLQAYPCEETALWHIGHAGGWRSFGHMVDEGTSA